jgi:hypothetical protein
MEKAPAIPQGSDGPWEVLVRAVKAPGVLQAHSAIQLIELFEEARFSTHDMTEGRRDDTVRALRQMLSELQASS